MVPVPVYTRPYCYYELMIDFKCRECLNTSLSAKGMLFIPGGRWLFVKPSSFEHMLFNVRVSAVCSLPSLQFLSIFMTNPTGGSLRT
jgi:hypothetical protein